MNNFIKMEPSYNKRDDQEDMEEGDPNLELKNEEEENNEDKELIYNEDSGFQNADKLFDDQSQESAFYEIEFRIFDKKKNKVL